jgi:hypothetical protein
VGNHPELKQNSEDKMGKDCSTCEYRYCCSLKKENYQIKEMNPTNEKINTEINIAIESAKQLQVSLDWLHKAMGINK